MIKDKFSKVLFYLLLSVIFVNLFVGDVFAITESSLQNQSSKEIPKSLLPQLVEKLGVANSNYHILNQNGRYISITPSHGIKTVFHKDKVVFNRAENNIGMSLVSDINEIYPEKVLDNKIEYKRGNITEWYVNSPYGVEQGFTIKNRPQGIGLEVSLNIEIDLSSNVKVIEGVNGKSVNFLDINDKHILNYSGLYAFDSTGKELPSNLRLKDNIIEISVDDRNAQYPITIDPFIQAQRVTAADPTSGAEDAFAWSVSIDGDRAIVGIPGWDGAAGSGQGAVIIYERNGLGVWVATPTLVSPDPGSNDNFGTAVAISGDWALIGEPDGDDGASNDGTAHFFMRSAGGAWTHQQTVFHTPGTEGESFGISVSISGDRAVVGDPEFELSLATRNSGAIYIYERSGATWNPVAGNPIFTSDSDRDDEFGTSVSISGDWLIAGAPGDSNNGGFSDFVQWGAVYFFQRVGGTWTEIQKVIGDTDNSLLGQAVSIDGTIAIAGSPGEPVTGTSSINAGAVYIFERSGTDWTIGSAMPDVTTTETRITASDQASADRFGQSVSIFGDMIVVGATGQDIGPPGGVDSISNPGSAYIYQRTAPEAWGNEQEVFASDPSFSAIFGQSVSISGDTILVGSPKADEVGAAEQGAGYFFDLSAMITIEKETNPDGATGFEFAGTGFPSTCGLDGSFTLDDDNSGGTSFIDCDVLPGSYTVQETNPNGHTLSDINCVGTNNFTETADSVTVNLLSDDTVVCTFTNNLEDTLHTLSLTKSGTGTGTVTSNPAGINCGVTCNADFQEGTVVTLTPVAAGGSVFVEFTGSGCTTGMVTVNADTTCDAVFNTVQGPQFSLNISKNGTGTGTVTSTPSGIDCGDTCNVDFNENTVVTLSPLASVGSEFTGWSGDPDCNDGIVTMDSAINCTATFNLSVVSSITLLPLDPSQGGVLNTFTITGATPNGQVQILWSFNEEDFPANNICPGFIAGIRNPRILTTLTANGSGTAIFSQNLPNSIVGATFKIQVVDLTPCEGSNVTTETIESSSSQEFPVLNALEPGALGPNTLTSTNHTPEGIVAIIWGFTEEPTNANNLCTGLQVGIRNFRNLRTAVVDDSGSVTINVTVPPAAAGATVKLQSIDLITCTPSNVITVTF